jgi:hypothetical protein
MLLQLFRSFLGARTALLLLAVSNITVAAAVEIGFDALPAGTFQNNLETQGLRISPYCHIDISDDLATSNWMGWDCSDGQRNVEYLGSQPPSKSVVPIYMDFSGTHFDFVSLVFRGSGGMIRSSTGAHLNFGASTRGYSELSFVGGDWSGISWFEIYSGNNGAPGIQIDSMTFSVSEPRMFSLLAAGLAAFALSRVNARRRIFESRSSRKDA